MPLTLLPLLLALLGAPAQAGAWSLSCPDCNVVVIAIDTLRPDHLGCYGYAKPTSPNIDRIARSGVVFDRFMVQSYLTPVSMASLFTSRYPTSNGFASFVSQVDKTMPMLPEILREFGFKTAAFLTSPEFFKRTVTSSGVSYPLVSFERGFDLYQYPKILRHPRDDPHSNAEAPKFRAVPGPEVFDWLDRSKDSRFFLWLALGSAHWPYGFAAPDRTRRLFSTSYRGSLDPDRLDWWEQIGRIYGGMLYPFPAKTADLPLRHDGPLRLTQEDKDMIIARYDSGIRYSDEFVGRIWEKLRMLGLDQKTIVVILSEHAEDLGEHGYYSHYDIYNTELRVPLILAHPGLKGGRHIGGLASGLDLAPTILDMVGIPQFHQAQGRSLVPRLADRKSASGDAEVFSERTPPWELVIYQSLLAYMPGELTKWGKSYATVLEPLVRTWKVELADIAVQTDRWKLIHRRSRSLMERFSWWGYLTGRRAVIPEYEFYDLSSDPLEARNVYVSSSPAVAPLKSLLTAFEATEDRKVGRSVRPKVVAYPYP